MRRIAQLAAEQFAICSSKCCNAGREYAGEHGEDEQGKPMGKQLAKWALRMNDLVSSFGSLLTCVVDRRRVWTFLGIEIFVHTA